MSLSKRDSPYANSGSSSPSRRTSGTAAAGQLAGVAFQRAIEQAAFRLGGGNMKAPAQRLPDFLRAPERLDRQVSYRPESPGLVDDVLPISWSPLCEMGWPTSNTREGFLHPDAVLVRRDRTSSPVACCGTPRTLESPAAEGSIRRGRGPAMPVASSARRSTAYE